jgi:hypothetical protein
MATKVNSDVFAILAEYSKVGTKKDSIYKPELLTGTEKERKSFRRKVRATRDNIISAFNSATNSEEKKKIATAWKSFATKVYKDTTIIFEANTTDDKAATIAEFVSNVNKVLAK